MGRTTDEGWLKFQKCIEHVTPRLIVEKLAGEVDEIDAVMVSNWKHGKARPNFKDLPAISTALGHEATYLAQQMGVIPDHSAHDLIRLQTRVQALAQQQRDLDLEVAKNRDGAVGKIVAEAARTGKWAVGIWPAIEGIKGYKFHVADRLDFVRLGDDIDSPEQLDHELTRERTEDDNVNEVGRALRNAHAQRSSAAQPRWTECMSATESPEAEKAKSSVLKYSVPRLAINFSAGITAPQRKQGSVAVVALSSQAWSRDLGAFLARLLNYGYTTTRALLTETYGFNPHTRAERERERAQESGFHSSLLAHPEPRYVWAHYEKTPRSLFPPVDEWPSTLTCVWLCETEELLRCTLDEGTAEKYLRAREEALAYIADLTNAERERVIRLDVGLPRGPEDEMLFELDLRNARMHQSLQLAVEAVKEMVARKFIDQRAAEKAFRDLAGRDRSNIAHTMFKWISDSQNFPADWP